MGKETLRSIGEATTELFGVDGVSPFGGVGNMDCMMVLIIQIKFVHTKI